MQERKSRLLDTAALWDYALKSLGGRAQSTGELRVKLQRRALKPEDIDPTLARLKESGYLNDARYAESFAISRLSGDKFGRGRVIRDLRQHRVAPPLAEESVQKVYEDVDEVVMIEDWVKRKYRTADREHLFEAEKDLASAYRRLIRAGFKSAEILKVLKRFAKNPELLDGFEEPAEEE